MSAREQEQALVASVEALLLRVVPGLAEQWQGATPDAIARIEQLAGHPLPPFYLWFLARMGQSMGALTFPSLDFSAQRVLECYAEQFVEPHPRFLLIADDSEEMMPLPLFYDFEASARADALVTAREAQGDEDELYDRFETLHEMLSWGALYRFRLRKMPQTCNGTLYGDAPDILALIEPVLDRLGFKKPISTGPYCGLYERADAVMICKGMPRQENDKVRTFNLGGSNEGALRKILGEIATVSALEVQVAEWSPALV